MSLFVIPKELIKASKTLIKQCKGSNIEALATDINEILLLLKKIKNAFSFVTNLYSLQEKVKSFIFNFKALDINEANYESSKKLADFLTHVVTMFGDEKYANTLFAKDVFDITIPTMDPVSVDLKAASKRYLHRIESKIKRYEKQNGITLKSTQPEVIEPIILVQEPQITSKLEEKELVDSTPTSDEDTKDADPYEEVHIPSNKVSKKVKQFTQKKADKISAFFNELAKLHAEIEEESDEDSHVKVHSNKHNQAVDPETTKQNPFASNSALDDANTSETHWPEMGEKKFQTIPKEEPEAVTLPDGFKKRKDEIKEQFGILITQYLEKDEYLPAAFNARESIKFRGEKKVFETSGQVKGCIDAALNNSQGYSHDERFKNTLNSIQSIKGLVPTFNDETILIYDALIDLAHSGVQGSIVDLYYEPYLGPEVDFYSNDKRAFLVELNELAGKKIKSSLEPFPKALKALQDALDNPTSANSQAFKQAGEEVYRTTKQAYEKGEVSENDLQKLVQFIKGTTDVINDPNTDNIKTHQENTEEVLGMNRKWTRVVGAAMLGVLGVALIAASIILAIGTFGGSTPLSAAGFVLGGNIIGVGVGLGLGMAFGVGLVTAGGLFGHRASKSNIALAGEQVINEAEIEKNKQQI